MLIKVNSLTESTLIQALYRASCAGVKIQLLVRGICGLRPGIPGLSENIEVLSIVGRLLEHSRIYVFGNSGDSLLFISSADLMDRNLHRRIETCCPIADPLKEKIIYELKELMFKDNEQAWRLLADGSYTRKDEGNPLSAQRQLLAMYSEI